jgi:signal transduction histidine kinase/ActR/RegA family two-component response regulator
MTASRTQGAANPAGGADPLRAEAIRTLYAQMRNTSFASLVITLYMIGVSWAFTSHAVILAWAAVAVATNLAREALIRSFHRRAPADSRLERWAAYYVAHQLLVGLVWGSTIFLFAHPEQPITVALTLCCLYSIPAGAVAGQSYTPASVYTLVASLFALVMGRFLSIGGFDYVLLAIATSLYGLTMVGFCRVQHRTLIDGFRMRFENRDLVDALTVQKASAEDARHKAEVASLAKSQFLAAASHDLRQPLYALSLFSASLAELKLDGEGRAVVGRIQDSIAVMESLFEGLLDVSKLDAGVVQARIAAVSIDALFDRLSQVFRPIAIERGLDLRFRCDGEWVLSDAVLLEQVLSNLVSNALRCTPAGGILVAARGRGSGLRLEVWDTGIGIAEPDRRRIFDEFVQLANPERDRRKGLGLGLAIAQRAAALIGGTIELASRPGLGSRFALVQPRVSQPSRDPARIEIVPARPARSGDALPVMIVDDDVEVRAALADLLARWGIDHRVFAGADDALASLESGQFYRLALCDYRLAGRMNGLELLSAFADRHPNPAPPRVLITGDFDSALLGAAHGQGVELLHKPVKPDVLRALLGLSPQRARLAGAAAR